MSEHTIFPDYISFEFDKNVLTFCLNIDGTKYMCNYPCDMKSKDVIYKVLADAVVNNKYSIKDSDKNQLTLIISDSNKTDFTFVLKPTNTTNTPTDKLEALDARLELLESYHKIQIGAQIEGQVEAPEQKKQDTNTISLTMEQILQRVFPPTVIKSDDAVMGLRCSSDVYEHMNIGITNYKLNLFPIEKDQDVSQDWILGYMLSYMSHKFGYHVKGIESISYPEPSQFWCFAGKITFEIDDTIKKNYKFGAEATGVPNLIIIKDNKQEPLVWKLSMSSQYF